MAPARLVTQPVLPQGAGDGFSVTSPGGGSGAGVRAPLPPVCSGPRGYGKVLSLPKAPVPRSCRRLGRTVAPLMRTPRHTVARPPRPGVHITEGAPRGAGDASARSCLVSGLATHLGGLACAPGVPPTSLPPCSHQPGLHGPPGPSASSQLAQGRLPGPGPGHSTEQGLPGCGDLGVREPGELDVSGKLQTGAGSDLRWQGPRCGWSTGCPGMVSRPWAWAWLEAPRDEAEPWTPRCPVGVGARRRPGPAVPVGCAPCPLSPRDQQGRGGRGRCPGITGDVGWPGAQLSSLGRQIGPQKVLRGHGVGGAWDRGDSTDPCGDRARARGHCQASELSAQTPSQ